MPTAATAAATSKRGLIVHDSLAFLALLGSSIALFGVTLFLFRSFQDHRVDLARRWSERGAAALQDGRPEEAVAALRTALSYDPDGATARTDQLRLAQALAAAGHLDEADNYFLNLWDTTPGDGFINLELARLARKKGEPGDADNYYRASVYGSWEGDGVVRRRAVRLELADFLIEQHQLSEARNELFTVAGNAPNDTSLNMTVAEKLESAGFPADALGFYKKASDADPHARLPLERAGEVAYALGNYAEAERLLNRALGARPAPGGEQDPSRLEALANDAQRIQQLNLTRDQAAGERAEHLLEAANVAQRRLKACAAANPSTVLASLSSEWTAATPSTTNRRKLLQNAATEDRWAQLIYTTEQTAAQTCGAPTGDDALLLRLANSAQPPAPAASPVAPQEQPETNRPSFVRRLLGTGSRAGTKEQPNHGK